MLEELNRIFLSVPFSEKDKAKKYGAKWDADKKLWYIDSKVKSPLIVKYIPYSIIVAPLFYYYIERECWKCGTINNLAVFTSKNIVPYINHLENFSFNEISTNMPIDDLNEAIENLLDSNCIYKEITSYSECDISISDLNLSTDNQLKNEVNFKLPNYKKSYSKTQNSYVFANHCSNCGAMQGNFFLNEVDLNEYGGGSIKRTIELNFINSKEIIVADFEYSITMINDISASVESLNTED